MTIRELGAALACLLLLSCAPKPIHSLAPAASSSADRDSLKAAFVVLGPGGMPVARAIVARASCPQVQVDGRTMAMQLRAAPGTEPLRPTVSPPALSKPSAFPVRVCDLALPKGTKHVSLEGRKLQLPPRQIDRIVVIGDTGCLREAGWPVHQHCNDPAAWPFARVAAQAAAWKPQLVIHVGDFLYRDIPCPKGEADCAGDVWGYGWDGWRADFFAPAAPLLAAAPWVMVRGNHERCDHAGQGWWRLLDPRPLLPGRDCNDPANDARGNYGPPYAVPLGDGAQLVVMDLSDSPYKPIPPSDPRYRQYRQSARFLARQSGKARFTFAVDHYPILGVAASFRKDGSVQLYPGNEALGPIFAAQQDNGRIMPPGVDVLLSGHVHVFEHVDFGGIEPSQFIAGFAGTQEDLEPLPKVLPPSDDPAPGVPVRQFDSILDKFGFLTLVRTGPISWNAVMHGVDGHALRRCTITGRTSHCDVPDPH